MNTKEKAKLVQGNLLLVLTALIWGSAFVAQSVGMEYVQPFTFNGIRSLMGGIFLLPVIFVMDRIRAGRGESLRPKTPTDRKNLWVGGVLCGVILFVATNMQQFGLAMPGVTAGKAGFLTALYIVLVPVLGLFIGKKVGWPVWVGVVLALFGIYLLCVTDGYAVAPGDLLVLGCALVFSVHILVIDHFSPLVDGVRMSCIQFLVSGVLSVLCMFLWEQPNWSAIISCWWPLVYAGIFSSGVAYTLQIVAQKDMPPAVASLVLSLESVFAALSGWVILHETMHVKELSGCVLVFLAILLAQLPTDFLRHRKAK